MLNYLFTVKTQHTFIDVSTLHLRLLKTSNCWNQYVTAM